jgi:hypothetical protein
MEPMPLEGQTFVHDPSTIVKENGIYYVFSTGRGVLSKSSRDLVHWTNGPSVFGQMPGWTLSAVPGFRGCWAPDAIRLNGQFYLYYAVSTFGKQVSAIGLATNPTLDTSSTNHHWTDRGPVIQSTSGSDFNTIDPSVMLDTDGKLWMAFGSFWKGIYLIQLDPKTGLRADTNSAPQRLAWNSKIEAACLTRHLESYYLFVNWGQCCRGTNSTYEIVEIIPVSSGQTAARGGPAATLVLSEDERGILLRELEMGGGSTLGLGAIAEGADVPRDVHVRAFPDTVVQKVSKVKGYRFFTAENRLAIVDARGAKVLLVIEQRR